MNTAKNDSGFSLLESIDDASDFIDVLNHNLFYYGRTKFNKDDLTLMAARNLYHDLVILKERLSNHFNF